MTVDILASDAIREGETMADAFRRLALEKPPTLTPCKGCAWCGQDHRGPSEYWPEGELLRHNRAAEEAETFSYGIGSGKDRSAYEGEYLGPNEEDLMWPYRIRVRCTGPYPTGWDEFCVDARWFEVRGLKVPGGKIKEEETGDDAGGAEG